MSYRFKLGESFEKGARRILISQVELAEQRLSTAGLGPEAVHDARKCFKRIRALLRLIRPGLSAAAFDRENAAFRDIAALLAGSRDRHVMLETAKAMAAEHRTLEGSMPKLALALGDPAPDGQAERPGARADVAEALERLGAARQRLKRLRLRGNGLDIVATSLATTQKAGRKAMREALETGNDEAFHEWRKTAQRHWRHMQLLSRAWPEYMAARVAPAKTVSQLLGEDHDIAVLLAFAGDRRQSKLSGREVLLWRKIGRAMQQDRRAAATTAGARLLAAAPKSLGRHVTALWEVAADAHRLERPAAKREGRRAAVADDED